jgi:hypothetical protein
MSTLLSSAPATGEAPAATALVPLPPLPPAATADEPDTAPPFTAPCDAPGPYPLGYALMRTMYGAGDEGMRVGESHFHRAAMYVCYRYHKNISRPLALGVPAQAVQTRGGHEG